MKYITILLLFLSVLNAKETRGFLTEEEIALFHRQGYLLKQKALSEEEISGVQHSVTIAIEDALEQAKQSVSSSGQEQALYINGSRAVFKKKDNATSIARINGCGGMAPSLLPLLRSEKMLLTFFELLGTNDLEHLIAQIHPKLPNDQIAFPKHRDIQFRKSFDPDWQDILGNGSYAICIIPIDPMTPENGGLWIDQNNYPEAQGAEENLLWIHAEPGDLLFMHPHLYHGSGENRSTSSRKTLLTGFCAFGANHKTYPGAHVNTRFTLLNEKEIVMTPAPWNQDLFIGSLSGH